MKLFLTIGLPTVVMFLAGLCFLSLVTQSSYSRSLTKSSESTARHLASMALSEDGTLIGAEDFSALARHAQKDFLLEKVKLFDAHGVVRNSTDPDDVGKANTAPYFLEIVARGRDHSKQVARQERTLEGRTVDRDVIETYAPIMNGDTFVGAVEIYSDISGLQSGLSADRKWTAVILLGICLLGLLSGVILYMLFARSDVEAELLGRLEHMRTPAIIVSLVIAAIFVAEVLVMTIMETLPEMRFAHKLFIDATMLSVFLLPLLYFLVFSPLHKLIQKSRQQNEELRGFLKEKDLLLREVHHRVKNNLALVHSFIELQSITYEDERTTTLLDDLQSRISTMGLVHEMLYQRESLREIELHDFVMKLINQVIIFDGSADRHVDIHADVPSLILHIDQLIPLGLILNELLTNCVRHAFADNVAPVLEVSLRESQDGGRMELVVGDNGPGFPADFNPAQSDTLGMQILRALSRQIGGEIHVLPHPRPGGGGLVTITFKGVRNQNG